MEPEIEWSYALFDCDTQLGVRGALKDGTAHAARFYVPHKRHIKAEDVVSAYPGLVDLAKSEVRKRLLSK